MKVITSPTGADTLLKPHVINMVEIDYYSGEEIRNEKSIGVSVGGGVALFDPRNEVLSELDKQVAAYSMLGFSLDAIAKVVSTNAITASEQEVKDVLDFASENLGVDLEADNALDKCLDHDPEFMVMTKAAPAKLLNDLTPLEASVINKMAMGMSTDNIAELMHRDRQYISSIETRIGKKLEFKQRKIAIATAIFTGKTGKSPIFYSRSKEVVEHWQRRPIPNRTYVIEPDYLTK